MSYWDVAFTYFDLLTNSVSVGILEKLDGELRHMLTTQVDNAMAKIAFSPDDNILWIHALNIDD